MYLVFEIAFIRKLLCMFVCVSAPKAINDYWQDMDPIPGNFLFLDVLNNITSAKIKLVEIKCVIS